MSELEKKEKLLKEIELSSYITTEGIRFDPKIFKEVIEEDPYLAPIHTCFDMSPDDTVNDVFPGSARLDNGILLAIKKNHSSPYQFVKDGNDFYVAEVETGKYLSRIWFPRSPKFYAQKTSDGVPMNTVFRAGAGPEFYEGTLQGTYSNECALLEKGKDCLFCNINATKRRFGDKQCIQWKNPKQFAEAVKAAYAEGYDKVTISGGYIPERREVEYYLDTAEAIQDALGQEYFNGTATIGAPKDLSIIEKYKEAGYSSIAMNIEIFGHDWFNAVCPGKVEACGDYEHWLEALSYAVEVFGKGNVRSGMVSGIQPKQNMIEGIEMLAEKGIVTTPAIWGPNIGSAYEGHRSPTKEWNWDMQLKNFNILKKNGRTFQEVYNSMGTGVPELQNLFKIDAGLFPPTEEEYYKNKANKTA